MMQDNTSEATNEGMVPVNIASAPEKRPPAKPPARKPATSAARKPARAPSARTPAKAPVKKAATPAVKAVRKAVPAKKPVARAAKAPVKVAPARIPARSASRPDRRLSGIRAAAGELSRALDAVEKARAILEESFARSAAGNLDRARGALETLHRLAEAAPLVDVRRLERELAILVEDAADLREREGKGRKRDLLAVDDFLGKAAARLEMAVSPAAGAHLKLLSERLEGLDALRRGHQAAVNERFRTRLESSRKVLGALPGSAGRLDDRALNAVVSELESAIGLCKAFPVGRLSGKPGDLYGIDGLVKRLDRRLSRVQALLSRRKEPSDG